MHRRIARGAAQCMAGLATAGGMLLGQPASPWGAALHPAWLTGPAAGAQPAASGSTLDWPGYGRDGTNARYAPAAALSPATAHALRLAWTFHTGVASAKSSFEATPVVAGGRLFIAAPDDTVFALDPGQRPAAVALRSAALPPPPGPAA